MSLESQPRQEDAEELTLFLTLFEERQLRYVWSKEEEQWCFSIVDK